MKKIFNHYFILGFVVCLFSSFIQQDFSHYFVNDRIENKDLPQVCIKNTLLKEQLLKLVQSDCFEESHYYYMDFYKSSLDSTKYILSIDVFSFSELDNGRINYYLMIDNKTFLIKNIISNEIFEKLDAHKNIPLKEELLCCPRGDYLFMLMFSLDGHSKIIQNTCQE